MGEKNSKLKLSSGKLRLLALFFALSLIVGVSYFLVSTVERLTKPSSSVPVPGTLEEATRMLSELEKVDSELDSQEAVRPGLPLSYSGNSRNELLKWQSQFRKELVDKLGKRLGPLHLEVKLAGSKDLFLDLEDGSKRIDYVRELVTYLGARNERVKAYFLYPKDNHKAKLPCVICVPGHSRLGVDEIVGIGKNGITRTKYGGEYNDYALQCLANGYCVLAIEQDGMACSRHWFVKLLGINGNTPCELPAILDGLTGQSILNVRIHDVFQGIDYLKTRSVVDIDRLSIMGASAGGTTALFCAALDKRIKCCVVVSYFNTFKDSILARRHCSCNYVFDLHDKADMSDIASLIAPRCLFIEYGAFDNYFPPQGARRAYLATRVAYSEISADSHLAREMAPRGHLGFWGKRVFRFMATCDSEKIKALSKEEHSK